MHDTTTYNVTLESLSKDSSISKAHPNGAGIDLRAVIDKTIFLDKGDRVTINTGLRINLPPNIEAQIRTRSGIASKFGVIVLNSPGTIDPGYSGEIKITLINLGNKRFFINNGDRIAQLCFNYIPNVNLELKGVQFIQGSDERASNGFGSSDLKSDINFNFNKFSILNYL